MVKSRSSADLDRIEALVRLRDVPAAMAAIAELVPSSEGSIADDALAVRVCDWYRRLGQFKAGFLALALAERRSRARHFWGARMLNLLGASAHARQLLALAEPSTVEELRVAGNILLSNFDYPQAQSAFERMRMIASASDLDRYENQLGLLGLADALAGLKRYDEADRIAADVVSWALARGERLLEAIALQARGEYLCRRGEVSEALPWLERAVELIPSNEATNDRAFALKWLGYAQARTGKRREGLALLDQALEILRAPGRREEAWVDVLRLKLELQALDPAERRTLATYPGLPEPLREQIRERFPSAPVREPRLESADLGIDLASREHWRDGRAQAYLPLELELAAQLVLAGAWGLSLTRAKALLWPGEAFSFFALDARVHQLLRRLRQEYGVDATIREGVIVLPSEARRRIRVRAAGVDSRPGFLRAHESFTGADLDVFYSLAPTRRFHLLKQWEARGWIVREGVGRWARYRSIPS